MAETEERIVMTPKRKTATSTSLAMERKRQPGSAGRKTSYVAGGEHQGIVINKETSGEEEAELGAGHLQLEFRVFLVSVTSGKHAQERRLLTFWFKAELAAQERPRYAQHFFKQLVSPLHFPRDYVGFIKKIMKLMQNEFPMFRKIEVELTQEKEIEKIPDRPTRPGALLFTVGVLHPEVCNEAPVTQPEASKASVLDMIEAAYPNPVSLEAMCSNFSGSSEAQLRHIISELQLDKKIKALEHNLNSFTRVAGLGDGETVTVVKQIPRVDGHNRQPTIAIITSMYHEKMAVDAMMTNRQTFVRYATVGETQAYTLGDIGGHRCVVTKLPMTGHSREASIASGSTTTRLLGTFQAVEFVLIVGVGGGVPHYTDYARHVRLGDVVLASPGPGPGERFIYQYCQTARVRDQAEPGEVVFETKSWCPPEPLLQRLAAEVREAEAAPWLLHYEAAAAELTGLEDGAAWARPAPATDKLYMSLGGGDMIEVGHPAPGPDGAAADPRSAGQPVLHLGPVAAGRGVALDDSLRQEFAYKNGVLCYDSELDSVVESVYGNRKDHYILVRGIADYKDGTRRKEWQHYAALMAASVAKCIIQNIPAESEQL